MKLLLGVTDIPYTDTSDKVRIDNSKPRISKSTTTGDVAEILEAKYDVMQHFVDLHMPDIEKSIENSLAGQLESLMMGAPVSNDAFGTAMGEIETLFKFTYLVKEEIAQTGQAGVPTQAAIDGISSRFKGGRGPRRPSFIDTGLYQASFKAWIP